MRRLTEITTGRQHIGPQFLAGGDPQLSAPALLSATASALDTRYVLMTV